MTPQRLLVNIWRIEQLKYNYITHSELISYYQATSSILSQYFAFLVTQ
jgi:hypothetical protein